jgi:site-specific recombinase XerD
MEIKYALLHYVEHLQYFKKHSAYSMRRIRQEITFLAKECTVQYLSDLTEEKMYQYFLQGNIKYNWQASTVCSKHITFKCFFNWCISKGYMSTNPIVDIPKPQKDKKIPPKLTKTEALRILDVVYHMPYRTKFLRYRNHAMLAVCLYAGLRRMEMLLLKYGDVDTENLTIFVRSGKGRKDRIIPMSHTLAIILREYIKERAKLKAEIPEFFVTRNGKSRIEVFSFVWYMKRFQKISGITFSLHKLRHTFATLMIEGGCDIYSLSKMMGHSDISTTTVYLAASVEHLRAQIQKHPMNNL